MCMCIHVYIYIANLCVCIHVYICMYIYTYTYMYIYIHIHICIHIYVYICIYVYVYIFICIYMHIYITRGPPSTQATLSCGARVGGSSYTCGWLIPRMNMGHVAQMNFQKSDDSRVAWVWVEPESRETAQRAVIAHVCVVQVTHVNGLFCELLTRHSRVWLDPFTCVTWWMGDGLFREWA